jgi:hypothetical protein
MQWELGIERKNIDLSIENEQFKLETPNTSMQFKLEWFVAGEMINQLRALMVPPFIQKETMAQDIDGTTLMLDFVMNSNDHWVMDLSYGNDKFYAELSRNDLGRIAYVLDSYLNS